MILEDFYKADKGVWRNFSCLLLGAPVSLELLYMDHSGEREMIIN